MARRLFASGLVFTLASYANAQFDSSDYSSGSNPYTSGDSGDDSSSSSSSSFGSSGDFSGSGFGDYAPPNKTVIIAHAALATIAFGLLFPSGSILIRLGSFRGLWLVHGMFQLFAYICYIAAFGIGVYMVRNIPSTMNIMTEAHPIIGIVLFIMLLFQPALGFIHHFAYKKYNTRVVWSYGHIWIGRIAITLGIINGGLGLQLGKKFDIVPPSQAHIIGYSVAAGAMWVIYVICAIIGERRRANSRTAAAVAALPPAYKSERSSEMGV